MIEMCSFFCSFFIYLLNNLLVNFQSMFVFCLRNMVIQIVFLIQLQDAAVNQIQPDESFYWKTLTVAKILTKLSNEISFTSLRWNKNAYLFSTLYSEMHHHYKVKFDVSHTLINIIQARYLVNQPWDKFWDHTILPLS